MADKERPRVPPLASVEAIEYGRRVTIPLRDKLRAWEAKALDEGDELKASKMRFAAYMIETTLLGYEDGGCVITAFDQRWLDPDFRKVMQEAREAAALPPTGRM